MDPLIYVNSCNSLFKFPVTPNANERHGGAHDGVEHPEQVGSAVLVDDHVTTYLTPVKAVVPDFDCRHQFEGNDMEHKDIKRVVAAIDQETLHDAVMAVNPRCDGMNHQETDGSRDW